MRRDYHPSPLPTSDILELFFQSYSENQVIFGDIINFLNERAFGFILLFLPFLTRYSLQPFQGYQHYLVFPFVLLPFR